MKKIYLAILTFAISVVLCVLMVEIPDELNLPSYLRHFSKEFYYDLDKKIYHRESQIPDVSFGKVNLSDYCISYLKNTNKKAEDINEDDLNIISIINY